MAAAPQPAVKPGQPAPATAQAAKPGQPAVAAPTAAAPQKPGQPVVAAQPAPKPGPKAPAGTAVAQSAPKPGQPGQPAAPAAKPGQPAPAGAPQAADAIRAAATASAPAKPKYEVRGRRDPFENLELAVKEKEASGGFSVAATKLTGIVHGQVPLALVETAEGHGYILKSGDMLGDGRVVEIGRDTVVFVVPPKPGSPNNRVVLKLTTD
ncbi:MAG: hypothetical protein HYU41_00930 [Candidatus Rokubacteria bacterium]|nr:hypothetical protein [Candidatus Rokubacteria bacterium]